VEPPAEEGEMFEERGAGKSRQQAGDGRGDRLPGASCLPHGDCGAVQAEEGEHEQGDGSEDDERLPAPAGDIVAVQSGGADEEASCGGNGHGNEGKEGDDVKGGKQQMVQGGGENAPQGEAGNYPLKQELSVGNGK